MTEADRTAIEAACIRLIHRYTNLGDAGRWEEAADLFTDDALFARPSAPDQPIRGRAAILAAFLSRPTRLSRHVCANIVVDVASATEAQAFSVILLFTGGKAEETPVGTLDSGLPVIGTFTDRLVLTDAGWRFAERRGTIDLRPA